MAGYKVGNAFVTVAPSFDNFQRQVAAWVKANLHDLTVHVTPQLTDTDKFRADLNALLRKRTITVVVEAEERKAAAEVDEAARDRKTTIDVDADVAEAEAEIDTASRDRKTTIETDVDGAAKAEAELDTVARSRTARIKVKLDQGLGGASAGLGAIQGALNPFSKSIFTQSSMMALLAGAAPFLAGPVGAPAVGAVGAAGAGILGSSGLAGVAASMIGNITSITKAQKDLVTQTTAVQTASDALASSQNSVISAQNDVSNATWSAAQAEKGLAEAQYQSKAAQEALTDAREAARRQLEGLNDTLRGTALAESGAKLAVQDAIINLQKLERDPNADRQSVLEAEQALKEAKLRRSEATRDRKYAVEDAKKVRTEGVAGNDAVVAARHQLTAAQQGVVNAQHSIAVANQQVAASHRELAAAQHAEAEATAAMSKATTSLGAAQQLLDSPAVKMFTTALSGLSTAWQGFQKSTQSAVLKVAADAMKAFTTVIERFGPATRVAARALGPLIDQFAKFFRNRPLFDRFLRVLADFGGALIKAFGRTAFALMKAFIRLFLDFEPLAKKWARALADGAEAFEKWTWGLRNTKGWKDFLAYIKSTGPTIWGILKDLVTIVGRLFVAFAPLSKKLFEGIKAAFDWIAGLDPNQFMALALAIGLLIDPIAGVVVGVVILYNVFSKLYGTNAAFTKWANGILATVSDIADNFVKFFKGMFDAASALWDRYGDKITKLLEDLGTMIADNLKVISDIFAVFGDLLSGNWSELWKDLKKLAKDFGKALEDAVQVIADAISLIWSLMCDAIEGLGKAIWTGLKDGAEAGAKLVKKGWTWLSSEVTTVLSDLADTVSGIWSGMWTDLQKGGVTAINWLINNVLNKLVDAINWMKNHSIIKAVIPDIPHVPTINATVPAATTAPQFRGFGVQPGMAEGGVLPGYTPGRDVHQFYSPTGGSLALAGGESIMVPEWTRMMGGARAVKAMNTAARHFATGGIFSGGQDRQEFRGVLLDLMTIAALQRSEKLLGEKFHLTQGSFSTSVAASGGTHAGGGAFDATFPWTPQAVAALRVGGPFAAWQRNPSQGPWPDHIHAILMGDPLLSAAAHSQVSQFLAGGNGLGGPDDGPHVGPAYAKGGSGGSWLGKALGGFASFITNPLGYVEDKLAGFWPDFMDGNPVTKMFKAIPLALIKKMVPAMLSSVGHLIGRIGGAASGPVSGPEQAQSFAQSQLSSFGWTADQFTPLVELWNRESGWRWNAENPSSGAYGIPQSLPGNKMAAAGSDWRTNPVTQIMWGLRYIAQRYGSPSGAWAHSQATGWYDSGGLATGQGLMAKGVVAPERILTPRQTLSFERLVNVLDRGSSQGRVQLTITNWQTGRGYMEAIADRQVAQDWAFRGSMTSMGSDN